VQPYQSSRLDVSDVLKKVVVDSVAKSNHQNSDQAARARSKRSSFAAFTLGDFNVFLDDSPQCC
jgi:hypothetical protein